jgi:TRAP-type C4-dicarboxylate transport system permease small subunit
VLERIETLLAYTAGLLLLFMILGICYGIVLRYFFHRPPLWVTGVIEYILLYVTLLGAGWLLRRDGHVKVDIALNRFSARGQAILNTMTSIVGALCCGVLVWYGIRTILKLLVPGRIIMTPQIPEIPKFILIAVIPLGCLFLFVEFVRRAFYHRGIMKGLKHKSGEELQRWNGI